MKTRSPGIVATTLLVTTGTWTFWGTAEMYYEGWGNPFPVPLFYLIPGRSATSAFNLPNVLLRVADGYRCVRDRVPGRP